MRARSQLEPVPRQHQAAGRRRVPRRDARARDRATIPTCSACRRSPPGRSAGSPSAMSPRGRRSARSRSPRELGRILTDVHHGLLRSAFTGQGNAIHLSPRLRVLGHWVLTLNTPPLPRRAGARARSRSRSNGSPGGRSGGSCRRSAPGPPTAGATWSRTCTARATPDERLPDAELLRAAWFATSHARPEDVVVLAGDFNVRPETRRPCARCRAGVGLLGPGPGSTTCSCAAPRARRSGAGTTRGAHAAMCCSQITPRSSSTSRRPSSPAIGWSAATTFAMCSSSSSSSSSAPS